MRLLEPPEVIPSPSLHLGIRLPEEMLDHDIFGGDRGIRLEIEREMTIGALLVEKRGRGFRNRGIQAGRIRFNGADDWVNKLGGGWHKGVVLHNNRARRSCFAAMRDDGTQ